MTANASAFPIVLRLDGRDVLLAGGGPLALRRAGQLLGAGARVHAVSPEPDPGLTALWEAGRLASLARELRLERYGPCVLALAAGAPEDWNRRLYDWGVGRGIPVNVADRTALCTFFMPAVVERGPLRVAVSTGGASPAMSRYVREWLERSLPPRIGRLAAWAGRYRALVQARVPDFEARQRVWQRVLGSAAAQRFAAGAPDVPDALPAVLEAAMDTAMTAAMDDPHAEGVGTVWLVGAGPGDPELLTVRALRVLQGADVVVHDRLVSPEVLALARPEARRIPVGKARGCHSVPQARIHEILVREARAGHTVVRLKGGDPFVFGRGGEELEALEAAAIPVEVVPGITAALGCAAEARIPLTQRGLAHQCVWVTGHRCDGDGEPDWSQLAQPGQTLVIYMGLHTLDETCARLMAHGMPADTPAALMQDGTTPRSRVLRGTVGTLAGLAHAARVEPPAVLIVGAVAGLGRNGGGARSLAASMDADTVARTGKPQRADRANLSTEPPGSAPLPRREEHHGEIRN